MLTWLIPIVGHLGICTSEGVIHDFAGPYFVNRNKKFTGFGRVTKYIRVDLHDFANLRRFSGDESSEEAIKAWDDAIEKASSDYDKMSHNLILNNCHAHVGTALNTLKYKGITYWNTLLLIMLMSYKGKFVSVGGFLKTYIGFFVLLCLAVIFVPAYLH